MCGVWRVYAYEMYRAMFLSTSKSGVDASNSITIFFSSNAYWDLQYVFVTSLFGLFNAHVKHSEIVYSDYCEGWATHAF